MATSSRNNGGQVRWEGEHLLLLLYSSLLLQYYSVYGISFLN